MLKVQKSPGEWSAGRAAPVTVLGGQRRRRGQYLCTAASAGRGRAGRSLHQGPSFVIVAALVGFVLFDLGHVLGPRVAFTC